MTKHCFILIAIASLVCACENEATQKAMNFPRWPSEEVYQYDTVDCSGLCCVPAEAITVKEAVEIGKALGSGGTTDEVYYIKGMVTGFNASKHESGMTGYGNACFYIKDNNTTNIEFYGFQVLGLNGEKFTSLDQLKVGDIVVICGKITNYNGTIETMSKGAAYIVCTNNELNYPEVDVHYYDETFPSSLGDWTQQIVTDPGMTIWNHFVSSQGNTSAMAYGTDGSTKHAGEVWLVSPAINLSQHKPQVAKLAFSTYYLHGGVKDQKPQDYLRLKVSKDGVNWTDFEIEKFNAGGMPQTEMDTIDISAYVSEGTRIAFAYKSTNTFAPKWSVSNISIVEHKRAPLCK